MKIKIIETYDKQHLEDEYNKFQDSIGIKVYATQTHVTVTPDGIMHTAIIYWEKQVK